MAHLIDFRRIRLHALWELGGYRDSCFRPENHHLLSTMYRTLAFRLFLLLNGGIVTGQTTVILDTDLDSDVDDVQALALLHVLADRGSIDLAGVVVTSRDRYAASCADAINTFYGRPDLPVGFLRHRDSLREDSRYTRHLANDFPHDIRDTSDTEPSVRLYRRLLAGARDSSVVIVTVGHLTAFRDFLLSPADDLSRLSGKELARIKVRKWLCMGGRYPAGKEANFYRPDPRSTAEALAHWEGEVIFSGWELGSLIVTGGQYLRDHLPVDHPVYQAFLHFNGFAGRPAWDQSIVLLLDPVADDFFEYLRGGYVSVNEEGENRWIPEAFPGKHHAYVLLRPAVKGERIGRYIDDLIIGQTKH